ncbi:flagellar hook-associated protein FlgK [Planktotalea sp.]|uniref:flagellar hook-associated protein FlgK n=1 Tax=Planktotalea sp. TaxID=2029877 RepID=UPI003D6BC19F
MSLSSSISNALSGLSVTSRAAQLVSENLANAMDANFSRRGLELTSSREGGASISGVHRFVDAALLSDRRNGLARAGLATESASSARALEQVIGSPDDPSSIPALLNNFDASLRFLEGDAGSEIRLKDTFASAKALANRLNSAQDSIQAQRLNADQKIASEVRSLNANLRQIVDLNEQIVAANVNGRDANALLDQRQKLIDSVSEIVPVREMPRNHGSTSLVTANGMMLVDDSAVEIEFSSANQILPHMTFQAGHLGGLEIDGQTIPFTSDTSPLAGGRLNALFEIRDTLAPKAQDQIDAFALDLATRFHELPRDSDVTLGAPGLFTDDGARVEQADQVGLAGRLQINLNVDPDQGGALWRLRSGMNAATALPPGDASIVTEMIAALGMQSPSSGTLFEHAASLTSNAAQTSSSLENEESFANARLSQLTQMQLQNGVDTDAELQKLLSIEMNYAANAKVIQTIDEMFATIMRIN